MNTTIKLPETVRASEDAASLETRLRAKFNPPAGFRMSYSTADFHEVGIHDADEHGGFWDGPVVQGEQWKVTSHWSAEQGITFYVDGDGDNAIPASEALKIAGALQEVAIMASPTVRDLGDLAAAYGVKASDMLG